MNNLLSLIKTTIHPTFTVTCDKEQELPTHLPPSDIEYIKLEHRAGNPWPWCTIEVTGNYHMLYHTEWLFDNSYPSEQAFIESYAYLAITETIIEELALQIQTLLKPILRELQQ